MPQLDPNVAAGMQRQAQEVKDRQAAGVSFTRMWQLTSQKTIVAPGQSVVTRLFPRWDYALSLILDPAGSGQRLPNPDYKPGYAFVEAWEHWWDVEGKTTREWCPKTFDAQVFCAVCAASAFLVASALEADRKYGKRIAAKQVFLFNAAIKDPRQLGDGGLVDVRPIPLTATLFNAVSDFMTGGTKGSAFARGDITHPREGFDVVLNRPAGSGVAWSADVAVNPSPLYNPAQAAAFKGWVARMVDLEEMLRRETKDPAGVFKSYYGRDPEPGEMGGGSSYVVDPAVATGGPAGTQPPGGAGAPDAGDGVVSQSSAPPEAPDDEFVTFLPGAAKTTPGAPAASASTPSVAGGGPRTPGRPAPGRGPRR